MKKIINEKQQQFPKRFYKNVVCLLITIIFMLSSYGCTTEKSVKNSSYNINEKVSFYYEDNDIPVKSDIEDATSLSCVSSVCWRKGEATSPGPIPLFQI